MQNIEVLLSLHNIILIRPSALRVRCILSEVDLLFRDALNGLRIRRLNTCILNITYLDKICLQTTSLMKLWINRLLYYVRFYGLISASVHCNIYGLSSQHVMYSPIASSLFNLCKRQVWFIIHLRNRTIFIFVARIYRVLFYVTDFGATWSCYLLMNPTILAKHWFWYRALTAFHTCDRMRVKVSRKLRFNRSKKNSLMQLCFFALFYLFDF